MTSPDLQNLAARWPQLTVDRRKDWWTLCCTMWAGQLAAARLKVLGDVWAARIPQVDREALLFTLPLGDDGYLTEPATRTLLAQARYQSEYVRTVLGGDPVALRTLHAGW